MKTCRYPYLFLLALLSGCIEPYPAPVTDGEVNYLVVDGSLNSTDGSVEVRLSHAVPLASDEPSPPELMAQLSLEDSDGNTYSLTEKGGGIYQQLGLTIDDTKEYRLHIRTVDNNEYTSDFVGIKQTPPIDSVTWRPNRTNDGVEILVHAHDDTGNTRYYQWTFEETYQYEAPFYSFQTVKDGEVVTVPVDQQTFTCWKTIPSQKILVGSSDRLNVDVIRDFVLTAVPVGSQKMIIKYTILVKQRALSRQAYDYWLNLQKTTEDLGGLFDPQPGQVTGNMHNLTNPAEPVLGYFDVGAAQEERIFIKSLDLPQELRSYKSIGNCTRDTVLVGNIPQFDTRVNILLDPIYGMGPAPIAYFFSSTYCADCRVQGGVLTKPSFWE